jgi:hypothetical protein
LETKIGGLKIVQYIVVEVREDVIAFQTTVNERIQDGWQPQGGMAVVYAPDTLEWWFYQAMIRKSD